MDKYLLNLETSLNSSSNKQNLMREYLNNKYRDFIFEYFFNEEKPSPTNLYKYFQKQDPVFEKNISFVAFKRWFYKIKNNFNELSEKRLVNLEHLLKFRTLKNQLYDLGNAGGVGHINTAPKVAQSHENLGASASRSIGSRQEMANAKIQPAPSLSGAGSVAQKQIATSTKSVAPKVSAPAIISDQKILEERDKKFLEELMGAQKKIEIDEEANFLSYLPKVEGVLKPLLNLEKYVKSILFGDNIYAVRAFQESGYTLYYDELGTIFDPFTKNAKRYNSVKNVNGNKEIILNLEDPLPVPVHFRGHTYIEGNFIYIYEKKNLGLTETVNPLSSTLEQELFKTFRQKWGNKRDYRQFFHNINNLS